VIAPIDLFLITEGSEERRKFIDSIISQLDSGYLRDLIKYMRILGHRNALLKQASYNGSSHQFQVWDEQLISAGNIIYKKRKEFSERFMPVFEKYYSFLAGEGETASVIYESQLHSGSFEDLLMRSYDKDRNFQFTTAGIHKDDLSVSVSDFGVKRYGSQGQQKSCIIALKLAQFEIMAAEKRFKPILLLDDIFEKLDHNRVSRLMEMVSHESFGQLFITDTHRERVQGIFSAIITEVKYFGVQNGKVIEEV
jgi:DNA replication and repair protein RecF